MNKYGLVVAGGGLAGVCAAVSAARSGAKVAFIQDRPVLGGNSSSEVRVAPLGAGAHNAGARETGLIGEIIEEYRNRLGSASHAGGEAFLWDLVLAEIVRREDNIALFLNTAVTDVLMKTAGTIASVKCINAETGKESILQAEYFIDTTGDGVVGFKAGAEYRMGRESKAEFNEPSAPSSADQKIMGSSIMFKAVDTGAPVKFIPPDWAYKYTDESFFDGRSHGDGKFGFWWLELGGEKLNTITDNELIREELLKHIMGVFDHIKNHCKDKKKAENLAIEWIGSVPGKRESRRLTGDYILTENDERNAVLFEDRVTYGGWHVDLHVPDDGFPKTRLSEVANRLHLNPFSIPFRSMYSRNICNLLFAGRNISVSHAGMGGLRVQLICASMGQAVGTAAAHCLKYNEPPANLCKKHIKELQQALLKNDCYIPDIKNEDPDDIAPGSTATASSSAKLEFIKGDQVLELDQELAQIFPVSSETVEQIELFLESRLHKDAFVRMHLREAQNIWDFKASKDIACTEGIVPANSRSWVKFNFNAKVMPGRLFCIYIEITPGIFLFYSKEKHFPAGTNLACRKQGWVNFESKCRGSLSLRLKPESSPYIPENVINGVSRAEKWTNLWVSDPGKSKRQWLELDFGNTKKFSIVHLTFDTNLNLDPSAAASLESDTAANLKNETFVNLAHPECVRDYKLSYWDKKNETWAEIVCVRNNFHRKRIHKFKPVKSSKLRIDILATNGDRSARIFEIRVY